MTVLRLYTEYSLLCGECRISEISQSAKDSGYTAVAKTDKGTLAGNVEFFENAKKKGITAILGCEINTFLCGETITLLILAKNKNGLFALNVYSSFSLTEENGFVPHEILPKYSKDIYAFWVDTKDIIEKSENNAKKVIETLKGYFPHLYGGIEIINEADKNTSLKTNAFFTQNGVEAVVTTPVYMTKKENGEILSILDFIKNGTESKKNHNYYLRTVEEIKALFSHLPQVLENTEEFEKEYTKEYKKELFAEFETTTFHLPTFNTDNTKNADSLLREKAFSGLRSLGFEKDEIYVNRLEEELSTIIKIGFSDYFLITEDFVSYAKRENIPIGPGRGSGVGSLVAYCLGITIVNPVENGLIFQRFLNEERVTMPDFDIDIGDEERERVISYVREKYGKKHVCGIANYSPIAFRQVIRDISKYLKYDASALIEAIPDKVGITVDEALKESPLLEKELIKSEKAREVIRLCKLLEGRPRVVSPHPSGIILTPKPVVSYAPLMKKDDITLTQYSMDTCAKLGLLKIDFLGIKYLTVISKAKKLIKEREGSVYDKIPPMDERVFQMLSEGESTGVFQLESEGMKKLLRDLAPKNLTELCDLISLYRPGPKAYIDSYIKGKNNPQSVTYPLPQLKEVLEETYGCPIYQEQIMMLCTKTAGFSLGKADLIRRAMAKKDISKMEKEKEYFVSGCIKNGIQKEKAEWLFGEISGFAKYAFNKSHGTAYALLAYETAYLKRLYPREYFTAKLEAEGGNTKKTAEYALSLLKEGFALLPPCINLSSDVFYPEEKGVRYSLTAIKGVGKQVAKKIVKERLTNGNFKNADDFISRVGATLGKHSALALARSGALDIFGENRSTLSNLCEDYASGGGIFSHSEDQLSLSFETSFESVKYERRHVEEYPETELRLFEKEYTGVDFHFNPDEFSAENGSKKYALYIKLTDENEKMLEYAFSFLTKDEKGSIVRIYDSRSGKTTELKETFFIPTVKGTDSLKEFLGEDNVKLKAIKKA